MTIKEWFDQNNLDQFDLSEIHISSRCYHTLNEGKGTKYAVERITLFTGTFQYLYEQMSINKEYPGMIDFLKQKIDKVYLSVSKYHDEPLLTIEMVIE